MYIEKVITDKIRDYIKDLNSGSLKDEYLSLIPTKKEFDGDLTFVVFPLAKVFKKSPSQIAESLGVFLLKECSIIKKFNVIQGFLNLCLKDDFLIKCLIYFSNSTFISKKVTELYKNDNHILSISPKIFLEPIRLNLKKQTTSANSISDSSMDDFSASTSFQKKKNIVIEFPSPNTNKPLHLGHLRNMFIGSAISNILEFIGNNVKRVNLVNDRGIHICKSMLAYQKYGKNQTPKDSDIKGDHFVGRYYVKFEKEYKKEKNSPPPISLLDQAQDLLKKWEENDPDVIKLWKKMNEWVYEGFNETYKLLNIKFDKTYYESQIYSFGKKMIIEGLNKGHFYKQEDNSIWIDFSDQGLDTKLLLRSDGTSVYITQDIGAAEQRFIDFKFDKSIYVVGNEQDYHFKILKKIMKKLKKNYADNILHLSYGMVDLPEGKMKSREGTVVDADNLIQEMIKIAKEHTEELGKFDTIGSIQSSLFESIGIGALKYFILKVDPKKRILFDPKASIDLQGDTGPFIQYTFARIFSLLHRAHCNNINDFREIFLKRQDFDFELSSIERKIVLHLWNFNKVLDSSANNLSPALVAQYVFSLSKLYNKFYAEIRIIQEKNIEIKYFRLFLSYVVGLIIKLSLQLLGIETLDKM